MCRQTRCLKTFRLKFIQNFTCIFNRPTYCFTIPFKIVMQYLMAWFLIAVRQEVKRIDNSVAKDELGISNERRLTGPFMKFR